MIKHVEAVNLGCRQLPHECVVHFIVSYTHLNFAIGVNKLTEYNYGK